jgi:cytochrome c oxidase assembly protein subunit 15
MRETQAHNRGLHRCAALTAAATLALIGVGGVVTSKGVGLSVPDWPTTYGYNMFFFPVSQWVGGIFYEHTHRLVASGVGLLTTLLAVWLWVKEPRRWVRWLGVAAFIGVVLQGVLGGLRVTELMDSLGIVHAALAQLFFALVAAIALVTSRWWLEAARAPAGVGTRELRFLYVSTTAVILLQLVLGATMRHQHAGLAIPDFPLAYGKWWPDMDAASVALHNQLRQETTAMNPITAGGIALQMAHRLVALLVMIGVLTTTWKTALRLGSKNLLSRVTLAWSALVAAQVLLGAATLWTDKSADIATLHVAVGALCLVNGVLLVLIHGRSFESIRARALERAQEGAGLGRARQMPA